MSFIEDIPDMNKKTKKIISQEDLNEFFKTSTCEFCKSDEGEREKIEKAKFLEEQEQARKDALENAHYLRPKTCDPDTCEYCRNEEIERYEDERMANAAKMTKLYGPNWRVNTGSPPGFT